MSTKCAVIIKINSGIKPIPWKGQVEWTNKNYITYWLALMFDSLICKSFFSLNLSKDIGNFGLSNNIHMIDILNLASRTILYLHLAI